MQLSVHLFLTDILPEKRRLFHRVVKNKIFGTLSADEVFAKMRGCGIEGMEVLLPGFVKLRDIEDLKKIAKSNKMKIFSIHQAWRFVTRTRIQEVRNLFEIADFLSVKVIVLHINSAKKQIYDQKYIQEIHALQDKYGIKVGFENMEKHAGSIINPSVWEEKKFASVMDKNNFYITLDICHLGQAGGDIISFFRNNKDRIINIHLSDYRSHILNNSLRPMRYKHMPLGRGTLPVKEFISALKSANYQGLLTLEIETNLDGLLESAEIVKKTS